MVYHRYGISMDDDGHVTSETTATTDSQTGVTTTQSLEYSYFTQGTGDTATGTWTHGAYQGGQVTHLRTDTGYSNKTDTDGTDTVYTYALWDDAMQATTVANYDTDAVHTQTKSTAYSTDANGHLWQAAITDDASRTVTYVNDASGQILYRSQTASTQTQGHATQHSYYYFDGVVVGDFGNDANAPETNYAQSIASRGTSPSNYGNVANFDESYDPVSGADASEPSYYTVNDGDTLQSIAQGVWGDASMWYLIAQANGLDGTETLAAGESLVIPDKVTNVHNNSTTFQVYDPTKAIGDTQPVAAQTSPAAQHHHKGCGFLGELVETFIAAAIMVALPEASPLITGLEAAGADAIAQGVGIATGIQDKFSFTQVAIAGLTAGLTKGMSEPGGFFDKVGLSGSIGGSPFLGNVVRGAITDVAVQGAELATGLEDKFDWAGVAAAGVTAGVTGAVAPYTASAGAQLGPRLAGMAGVIAGAASRSLLTGTDFGDNLVATLPSALADIGVGLATVGYDAYAASLANAPSAAAPPDTSNDAATAAQQQAVADQQAVPVNAPTMMPTGYLNLPAPVTDPGSAPTQGYDDGGSSISLQHPDGVKGLGLGAQYINVSLSGSTSQTILAKYSSGLASGQSTLLFAPNLAISLFGPGATIQPLDMQADGTFLQDAVYDTKNLGLTAVIVGPQYQILNGIDIDAEEGLSTKDGQVISGHSAPDRYYVSDNYDGHLSFGIGDPPLGHGTSAYGIGGGNPIIINGQPFSAPSEGWGVYSDSSAFTRGKNILAYSSSSGVIASLVQPDGTQGYSMAQIRDYLIKSGFDNALAFDGGSSASLVYKGKIIYSPAAIKNITIPLAIGITSNKRGG